MAASYTFRVDSCLLQFLAQYTENGDLNRKIAKFKHSWGLTFLDGTGTGKANWAYQEQITITLSNTATRNLASLVDEITKATVAFTKVKGIFVRLNSSTDPAATLKVGAAGSNAFSAIFADPTDAVTLRVGNWIGFGSNDAGMTVDGTHKNILLTNNSSTQSIIVDLVVVGEK